MVKKFLILTAVLCLNFFVVQRALADGISGVQATNIIGPGAQIIWSTNVAADSHVDYGTTSGYGTPSDSRCDVGGYATSHCVNLTGLAASTVYFYQVKSVNASGTVSTLGGFQFTSAAGSVPTAPSLTLPPSSGIPVAVNWTSVSGAASYSLYRRTPPVSGSWTSVASGLTGTSYSDSGVTTGTSYEYHVNACNTSGCSPDSNYASVSVSSPDTQPPTVPAGLVASSTSSSQINLYWSASTDNVGVAGYKVYRNSTFVNSVTTLSYSDTGLSAGITYSYTVAAYDAAGNISAQSGSVSATTPSSGSPPPAPSIVPSTPPTPSVPSATFRSLSSIMSGIPITVSWSTVTGASWYNFSRRTPPVSTNPWTLIGSALSGTSYSDSNVAAGISYEYHVAACNSFGCSADSNSVSVTVSGGAATSTVPTAPSLTLPPSSGIPVAVNWTSVSGATSYSLYRRTPPVSGSWTSVASGLTGTSYSDSGVTTGTSYEYHVNACNTSGCSVDSNYAPVSVVSSTDTTPPSIPTNLVANYLYSNQVNLSWSPSTDNVGVSGYKVYRSVNAVWSPIGQSASTYYYDTTVTPSTPYYYYVTAYDAAGNNSASSSPPLFLNTPAATSTLPGTSTTTVDIIPPSVQTFGYSTQTDGHLRAGAVFSEAVNQDTLSDSNVYIASADGVKVAGTVNKYPPNGVDYLTSASAVAGVDYQLVVKKGIKDLAGNQMLADYASPKFRANVPLPTPTSTTVVGFYVDESNTFPKNNSVGIDLLTHIRVKFSKEFDPASTVGQFFSLVKSSTPDTPLPGSFYLGSDGFEFVPSVALQPGIVYTYRVLTSIKDKNRNSLANIFSASFTTASQATYSAATVMGSVTDAGGLPVANAGVRIWSGNYLLSFGATTKGDGSFSFNVPAGIYWVEVFAPPGVNLARPAPMQFSVAPGETKTLFLSFAGAGKTITGTVTLSTGDVVADAEVGAYSSESNQWISMFVDSSGRYTLNVGGGHWQVGIRPKDQSVARWSWVGEFPSVDFAKDSTVETRTVNFVIPVLDAKLSVIIQDQSGAILSGAGVVADTVSASAAFSSTRPPPVFRKSDSGGTAVFLLKAGTYFVRAFLPPELGYFNPEEQQVDVASGATKAITLVFRKPEAIQTVTIRGKTSLRGGQLTDAFVWAWSEKGGSRNTRANASGEFTLALPIGSRWHIGAGHEVAQIPYKSSEAIVDTFAPLGLVELVLERVGPLPLPPPVTVSQSAAQQIVAQAQDGAKITIPPAAAASGGDVNVKIKPTVEAPSQAAAKVVSTVYDISLSDNAGNNIENLAQETEIVIPYKPEDLKTQGVTEESLVPSFYDESTGTWVKVDNYTIDKVKKVVVMRVKHLTRFALVAAADVTPPSAPTNVKAANGNPGEIIISWSNPTQDFSHVKIYRSAQKGTLGDIIGNNIVTERFSDKKGLIAGTKYYYTIRAVDPAGNESLNAEQVIVKSLGTTSGAKGKMPRNLSVGTRGDDVKTLQELLVKEGVYPGGKVTGFFGNLTRQAVIRFQEKYADDILKPAGLKQGNGFVGAGTRAKIEKLLQ